MADSTRWDAVMKRAREGSGDPLVPIGHRGEVDDHPVAEGDPVRSSARPASADRTSASTFEAPPYGWPQDAIDGSLLALVADGKVLARYNGEPVTAAKLPQNVIGSADFRVRDGGRRRCTDRLEGPGPRGRPRIADPGRRG